MRAEYSLVGYISTDSLLMSPYSSNDGSSFTIKSSRLISEFTFLAFAQCKLIWLGCTALACLAACAYVYGFA